MVGSDGAARRSAAPAAIAAIAPRPRWRSRPAPCRSMPGRPIGQIRRSIASARQALARSRPDEAGALGVRADQPDAGRSVAAQRGGDDLEVELMVVRHDQHAACRAGNAATACAGCAVTHRHDIAAAGWPATPPAADRSRSPGTADRPSSFTSALPTWPAPNSATCSRGGRISSNSTRDMAAAALAERRAERKVARVHGRRRRRQQRARRGLALVLQVAAADRAGDAVGRDHHLGSRPRAAWSLARPARSPARRLARHAPPPRARRASAAITRPLPHRAPPSAGAAPRSPSAPAPASPARRAAAARRRPHAATASRSAWNTAMPSISGGSPTALER